MAKRRTGRNISQQINNSWFHLFYIRTFIRCCCWSWCCYEKNNDIYLKAFECKYFLSSIRHGIKTAEKELEMELRTLLKQSASLIICLFYFRVKTSKIFFLNYLPDKSYLSDFRRWRSHQEQISKRNKAFTKISFEETNHMILFCLLPPKVLLRAERGEKTIEIKQSYL